MPQPEAVIQRVLLARINALPGVHLDRINVTVSRAGGRFIRSAPDGFPDSIGAARGTPLAVEYKSSTGVQSPAQRAWQAKWEAAGGLYLLARDIDQTLSELQARLPPAREEFP